MVIYIVLAILYVYSYGSAIFENLLDNMTSKNGYWDTYVLRGSFLVMISCHIPFVFFYGREQFMIIIDELDRKSVST